MLNFERAKLFYDIYDGNSKESNDTMYEFVNTLGPTLMKIVSRNSKIDEYSKLSKVEHNLKFKTSDNLQGNLEQNFESLNTEQPLFFKINRYTKTKRLKGFTRKEFQA